MPSADHLVSGEPAFQWGFYIIIEKVPGITMYVKSAKLPTVSFEQVEIPCKSYKKTIAGKKTHEQLSVVVRDYVSPDIASQIYSWIRLIQSSPDAPFSNPRQYKSSAIYIVTDSRGQPRQTWLLTGCWPSSVNFGDVDYSSQELIEIEMTLEADTVKMM